MINEILSSIVAVALGVMALFAVVRRFAGFEQRYIALSFLAHLGAALVQIWITHSLYEGGDMTIYMSDGSLLARAIEIDPWRFGTYWVNLLLQREQDEVLPLLGAGSSTGSMVAIAAALALAFRYSLNASGLIVASVACLSKVVMYRTFRDLLPQSHRRSLLIAILLIPSVVLWSSGIVKEAFVIIGLGPFWLGVHRFLQGKLVRGVILALLGAFLIQLVKPYTLLPLAMAAAVWIAADRTHAAQGRVGPIRVRPAYVLLGIGLVFAGVTLLGILNPRYAIENLGDDLSKHQQIGTIVRGGSYYTGVELDDEVATSLQWQIFHAPLALLTSLFRPLIFEARNGLAFVASLESTTFTILVFYLLYRQGPRNVAKALMSKPILIASFVFVIVFGTGVSLATKNFGSLSRYRMPLIPFYASIIFVLRPPFQRSTEVVRTKKGGLASKNRLPAPPPRELPLASIQRKRLTGPKTTS